MLVLKYGMIGDEVKALQKQLNEASTTRLPRLALDTKFDPLTMARVMEFQHQMGASTDGVVGPITDPSTRGVFKVTRRLRNHTSSQFPIPPGNMDFSLFYHRGEALHQGPPTVPSHGCIHVKPSEAAQLFYWAGQVDLMVIVMKLTPR